MGKEHNDQESYGIADKEDGDGDRSEVVEYGISKEGWRYSRRHFGYLLLLPLLHNRAYIDQREHQVGSLLEDHEQGVRGGHPPPPVSHAQQADSCDNQDKCQQEIY